MKKSLICIFSAILIICMALPCLAVGTEATDGFDMESYLTEKIVPVLMGVATSVVALFGGLAKIRGAVNGLDKTGKEIGEIKKSAELTLSGLEKELEKGISRIEAEINGIPEIKEGYEEIRESCRALKEQNEKLLLALRLGFESFPEAVKCGNAHKIAVLTENESSAEAEI